MNRMYIVFSVLFILCGSTNASILIMSQDGKYKHLSSLADAATSPYVAGKTVIVTSALSPIMSNISSASIHSWPTDRKLEIKSGGSISNTTKFNIQGKFESGLHQVFKGSGIISFGTGSVIEVYPEWWGAKGDSKTNDWQALQQSHDAIAVHGGILKLSAQSVYRVKGNTLVIWGSNIKIHGYGATIKKDDGEGSAGNYGDAVSVRGKIHDLDYYGPAFGATYSRRAAYKGATIPSQRIAIEGLTVTFGTSHSTSINGISGINYDGYDVSNCRVFGAPQTGFAFVASGADALNLKVENCVSDGAQAQGFRFNSYSPIGSVTATMINCKSENTVNTGTPLPTENAGVVVGLAMRSGASAKVKFEVTLINCYFDKTVTVLNGHNRIVFNNCRLTNLYADGENTNIMMDSPTFTEYTTVYKVSSLIKLQNTTASPSRIIVRNGQGVEPTKSSHNAIFSRGFDVEIDGFGTAINGYYAIGSASYDNTVKLSNCTIKTPSGGDNTFNAANVFVEHCIIKSPIKFGAQVKSHFISK